MFRLCVAVMLCTAVFFYYTQMLSKSNREILEIALPSIVANITAPLMAMADTAIAGHLGSEKYIAAIAIGASLFNMLYWGFAFLRMGTSGMTAQAVGARDADTQTVILLRSLLVAFTIGMVMIFLQRPLIHFMVKFMEAKGEVETLVNTYTRICIYGAPAMLGMYALSGWFIGSQNSRRPMFISIAVNLINICLSLTLVFSFHLTMAGIALGTLIAQWCGLLIGLYFVMADRLQVTKSHIRNILDLDGIKRFFSINTDIFLRTLCLIAVTLWFTRCGAEQGDIMLSVNAILMQFFIIFSYFADGFAYAGEALAGKYCGAKDTVSMATTVRNLFKWGLCIALVFACVYYLFGMNIVTLLTDSETVKTQAAEYVVWVSLVPIAGIAAFIWDGIYIGLTRTRSMLLSMFTAMVVFFAIWHFIFPLWANDALWFAFISYLAVRGIVLRVLYNFTSK